LAKGRENPGLPGNTISSGSQGANKNLAFVNNQTVCYPCGSYILFLDIKTKKTRAVQCQSGQVGAFAANASSQVVAFSDRKLNPLIHIYTFPDLSKLTELKGDVQLDYTLLAFSFRGPYLASYSSIPEFVLSVWNWKENILLCSKSQPGITGTSLSFNPMNWQQLCFVAESSVTIWRVERSKDEHHLTGHPVELPDDCGVVSPREELFFPPSRNDDPYYGPDLPVSAVAGLEGDEAETFVPRNCVKNSVHPTAHCWTATSEIYMGCKEGYVLVIDAEQYSVSVLQQKAPPGILIFYHIKGLQYEIKICAEISQPISSLIFSPDYTSLLLVTDQATSMACCPSSNSVAVGTQIGQICFLDVTKAEDPRVVHRTFLSKLPVLSLHYDQSGQFLIARATEGHIFILDARPSKLFQVLGYIGNTLYLKSDILAQKHCQSYQGGGIRSMVFSLDGKFILVNGENDCALVCLKWKYARREIEMENLFHCYLQDLIKYECWDVMCVKGRAVKCFHVDCQVSNYPLKERSKEELETVKKVLQLKKTGTADLKVQIMIFCAQETNLEVDSETALSEEEGEKAAEVDDDGAPHCLSGSLSSQYGGDTSVLYHQCDLHTKEQKLNQIILLKDIIYKVKTAFNEEFDVVVQKKEQEIARVKERNLKIQEILEQLELQEEVWEPVLTDDEMPERALTVQDSEIKAEKYMTQEEKEQAELLARLEMERRLAATDDERLRALDDMMGGVLEIRREDILKMDIPPPSFISRPEDLWTEEEKKIFEEYEKNVKELNEEKEDYRQFLRNEWNKLEASIKETTQNFDEIVRKLFEKKVKSEMVVYQEELKIACLIYTLLLDEELDTREAGLHKFLTKKKKEKVGYHLEKNTKYILSVLFVCTRTPRTETLLNTANPYVTGSPEDYQGALSLLMKAMDELDSPEHRPSGLDQSVWERFCLARRNKRKTEELVKWKSLALSEMQACLQRRVDENEKMRSELENTFQELTWLKEEKMKLQQNLTVQFLLKQGQVELESTRIPDYSDAILIDRSVVEELNCSIAAQGEKKITAMVEFKDFSKGIIQLEWEHKKMKMQIQDLKEKARDIVILPISKDCQLFLTAHNYDTHITQHLAGMEESLGVMDKLHKKNVKSHQKKVRELKKYIRLKEQANYELSLQLKEMLVSVSERMHIFKAAGESNTRDISEKKTRQRYQEILKQKYLRNLIREQEKQLEILQSEVESWEPITPHITYKSEAR
uniref:Cilia- and flagella-associated protein 43 n=1 Tax=Cyanistes caeruleus TaxID=156563 RepID=A0A8C0U4B7_CYACU